MFVVLFAILASASASVIQNATQSALANAAQQNVPIKGAIDSIFLRLPSESDLKTIIFSADTVALAKLIQTIEVKGGQIPCDALAVYSDQVIGMIKVVLERKTLTSAQLQVVIQGAEEEIVRINNEIERLNNSRNSLKLTILRNNLDELVKKLQEQYDSYNQQNKKVTPLQAQIDGYTQEISILQGHAEEDRALATRRKLDVADYEANIRRLQSELASFQGKKTSALAEIKGAEIRVAENEKKIVQTRNLIAGLEKQITDINAKSDEIKKMYIQLEIEVQRLRTDISIGVAKENDLVNSLNDYEKRLISERDKLAYRELDYLNSMIKTLGNSLPKFFQQNNDIYFNCFGNGSVEAVKTGSTVVYIIRGARMFNYLNQIYNYKGKGLAISDSTNLRFSTVDTLGSIWANAYGAPFSDTQLSETSLYASGDFNCFSPSQVQPGYGIIQSIKGNAIAIKDSQGKQVVLKIGACSRIEDTEAIPKPGKQIVFKGIFNEKGSEVNIYAATCF